MFNFKSKVIPVKKTWQVVLYYRWGDKSKLKGMSIMFADCYTKAVAKYICIKNLKDTVHNVTRVKRPIVTVIEPEQQYFGYGL
jgi:hypothetical protein